MPRIRMHTFHQKHLGRTAKPTWVFRWDDDPSEDVDFLQEMLGSLEDSPILNHIELDRSGAAPVLHWKDHLGNSYSVPLTAGQYWHHNVLTVGNPLPGPGVIDATGYWKCDEYGRPYDLNDLLA